MIPRLGAAAKRGHVSLPEMMAMAAYGTQAIGDTSGEETTTALVGLASKMMLQTGEIEKATGVRLEGNLLERLSQFRDARLDGTITDDQLAKAFPKIGAKGSTGRVLISSLFSEEGFAQMNEGVGIMTSDEVLRGDQVATDLETMRNVLAGGKEVASLNKTQSAIEAGRANDPVRTSIDSRVKEFEKIWEIEGKTDDYIKYASMRARQLMEENAIIDTNKRAFFPRSDTPHMVKDELGDQNIALGALRYFKVLPESYHAEYPIVDKPYSAEYIEAAAEGAGERADHSGLTGKGAKRIISIDSSETQRRFDQAFPREFLEDLKRSVRDGVREGAASSNLQGSGKRIGTGNLDN